MADIGKKYKVWIEVGKGAVKKNIKTFRGLIDKKTKLFAVVKSNAYGHGLLLFSSIADQCGVDGFCVDSVVEGLKLRKNGIQKPILVLGYTLPYLYETAAHNDITVTISSFEAFRALRRAKQKPQFHIKIDTGMHRQGLYLNDLEKVIKKIKNQKSKIKDLLKGVYTHFAMAKDCSDTTFTDEQNEIFKKAIILFEQAGFTNLLHHASATGGTLLGKQFHYDAVRVGIGLYGVWPSEELEQQLGKKIVLQSALCLKSIISEVKLISRGEGVGYDVTERAEGPMRLAIVPIGYWHGIPRAASSIGFVSLGAMQHKKRKVKIIGRVSMDVIMVDVTDIPCRVGNIVSIDMVLLARTLNASPYEMLTRINPLIYKISV